MASVVTLPLLTQASASQVAGNSGNVQCPGSQIAVDITLASFTGGTAPTVTFIVDRLGTDGVWYPVWTSTPQSVAGVVSTSIGPGCAVAQVVTGVIRLRWTFGGTVAPTAVTFSSSIVGR